MPRPDQTLEIQVEIDDAPGGLADVAERLGKENINILGFMADAGTQPGEASFVTSDSELALDTLRKAGYEPEATEALIVPAEHRPGELASLARQLEKEDIGVERSFVATSEDGEQIGIGLSVSDPSRARLLFDR